MGDQPMAISFAKDRIRLADSLALWVVAARVPASEQFSLGYGNMIPCADQFFWSPRLAYQFLTSFF